MRILVEQAPAASSSRYRRFIQRAQLYGLLADHLYHGEPYLALNAVVLNREESALLQRLSETFVTVFERAARSLARDVAGLEEMGFPWAAAELLAAETPRTPLAGRFDFVSDADGHWWLLEFNADTPSGIREAIVADRLVHELLLESRTCERPNTGLAQSLVGAFRAAVKGLPTGSRLGLLTDAAELEDLAQMAYTERLLRAALAADGFGVVLGSTSNLRETRSGLTLLGERIAALYRYVPFEAMYGTNAFAAIYDSVAAGRLRLLNGLFGLLLQHKGLLAWVWSHRDAPQFTEPERAAIWGHLPPTGPVERLPAKVQRAELVAKQVFGREGEEVFFGEDCSAEAWEALLNQRTYIAQQRIVTAEHEAAIPVSTGWQRRRGHLTVGSYVVNGRWAGYYTRFGDKITTAAAKWLATFVEGKGPS